MPLVFAIKGFAIGFAIAAPVGPIGVLCIRRSLAEEKWIGLITGLGAATADAAYGAIAAFGLTAMSGFLVAQTTVARITRRFVSRLFGNPHAREQAGR